MSGESPGPRTGLRVQATHRPLRRLGFRGTPLTTLGPEAPDRGRVWWSWGAVRLSGKESERGSGVLGSGGRAREPGIWELGGREPGQRTETVGRGGPGGRPPGIVAAVGECGRRPPTMTSRLVGEEGFEPSRPCGHTDLNRARLPFRHPPGQRVRLARPRAHPHRRYHRMRAGEGGTRWECCSASSAGSKAW